jgi:hypothetical protein
MCKSRPCMPLGKLPMVRRTLFCGLCNFSRLVSAANSQARQAYVTLLRVSTLWRVKLILALNRSLLNREYTLIYVWYEDLGFNHFYVQSPCNSLIENYTEIF